MIASSLLVTVLLASLRSQTSSIQLMKSARETELATELLREAMAQAFFATNAELVEEGGAYAPGVAIATSEVLAGQTLSYTLPEVQGDEVPAYLQVLFQITWTSYSGQQRRLSLAGGKR